MVTLMELYIDLTNSSSAVVQAYLAFDKASKTFLSCIKKEITSLVKKHT